MNDGDEIRNHAAFIWSVADLVRGSYKRSAYGNVVLPVTVIRRFVFGPLSALQVGPVS